VWYTDPIMATTQDFAEFVCDQISGAGSGASAGAGAVRFRKMFGEYMIYVNDKPILLVCDNTVYVKKLDVAAPLLAEAPRGIPYNGAKEHYILDIEDRDLSLQVIAALLPVTKVPVKKKKA
jgi:TfoX/Sxy family transcriptional regulator of competence genes